MLALILNSKFGQSRAWLSGLALTLFVTSAGLVGADEPSAAAKPANPKGAPVILLTGFEPFGPGRPPNPSWEAVKKLDGQSWRGYRLVAKQLPCVWGQPLEKLSAHLDALHPVAIFSFGQGMPGAFAIETLASNRRGNIPDNEGRRPPRASIVPDGPAQFRATIDAEKLQKRLAANKHDVRISERAGAYLCEETLYTLEYLKQQRPDLKQVMFCHVPPLDKDRVTPEFVRQFVEDVLEAWLATYVAPGGPGPVPNGPAKGPSKDKSSDARDQRPAPRENAVAAATTVVTLCGDEPVTPVLAETPAEKPTPAKPVKEDPRTADVKKFVERYFRTWSNREMDAYGEGFLREAVVQFIDDRGQVNTQGTVEFLADQRRFQSLRPAKEYPLAADVRFEGPLARAVVHWKLEDGANPPRYGYDHFTLVRRDGQWRILNLVFYGTDPPKNGK